MTTFTAIFAESDQDFTPSFDQVIKTSDYKTYPGPYSATPKVDEQILQTAHQVCVDNIIVEAVPYLEVQNPQGGYTATIAYL